MSISISCFECNCLKKIEINPYENYENNQMNENNINQRINEAINENDSNTNNWVCIDCVDKFQKQYEKVIANKTSEKENFIKGLKNLIIDLHDEKLEQYLKKDSNKLEKENIEKSKEYKELKEKEKEYKNEIETLKKELIKLEKENNHLNNLEKELTFIKQNEENIIKTSSLNELYKIELNKECTLNKNSFISYNNRDGLNKGMNDLIYLTEIISSTLNFSTKKYSLYSGFMGPKILNREEKKLYLLHIRNNDSSSKMLFLDGIEQYKSYLSELLSYINSKYNIGDLSYSPNILKNINGFENLDISQSSIEEAINFLYSILTHKKLKEYFNYEQI